MTRQEGQLCTLESVEFVVQALNLESSGLHAHSNLATVEGWDVETGVIGGLNEDDHPSRRVHEVYHAVTCGRAGADDLAWVEVDADYGTWKEGREKNA